MRIEEINKQELALWWIDNILKFIAYLPLAIIIYIAYLAWDRPVVIIISRDKYNLNTRQLFCAPASLEGKTVTNCIEK